MINTYISSSNINRVGWANRVLYVEFHHGGVYAYKGVDFNDYARLVAAESVGQHFHKEVRYAYEYSKLDYDPFKVKPKARTQFEFKPLLTTKKQRIIQQFKETHQ